MPTARTRPQPTASNGSTLSIKRAKQKAAPLPTKEELLTYIRESPTPVGKRDLARAFRISGASRVRLKAMLKELQEEGALGRDRGRRFASAGSLPAVTVVEVTGTDADGEVVARPLAWSAEIPPPRIYMAPDRRGTPALGPGDRVLARLRAIGAGQYEGRTIRRISEAPGKVLGVYMPAPDGGRIRPTDRRVKAEYAVARGDQGNAKEGELVLADVLPGHQLGLRQARIVERIGHLDDPRSISLIAIFSRGIPVDFPADALAQAAAARAVGLEGRVDLRAIPLVTIDGEDARDFDDAVWAESDPDPANAGGWHLLVAIADVAHYVRPGDPLDRAAAERGNSAYFPDRVVPMLPEALSNGWCSLKPAEDRGCLAAHIWIDHAGHKLRHRFERGLMRSAARLTYTQVQAAIDGHPNELTRPLVEPVLRPLYGAYHALGRARERRGTLDLDLPERRILLESSGKVARIEPRRRLDSHRLIEEFMIAANVAAAEELERLRQPCMYRVHDQPDPAKLAALREFLDGLGMHGLKLAKGQVVRPRHFSEILRRAAGTPYAQLVSELVLRSQAQAVYSPTNLGHFGLALRRYAHFTSPIRRYSDLLVHRALIAGHRFGGGASEPVDAKDFAATGEHISMTERRAAAAERSAVDRYTAAFLAERVGASFAGRVTGVTRAGLFVGLNETGADGLVPMRTLPADYYDHDEKQHRLVGRRWGRIYRLGDELSVRLVEANTVTGSLLFALAHQEDAAFPPRRRGRR